MRSANQTFASRLLLITALVVAAVALAVGLAFSQQTEATPQDSPERIELDVQPSAREPGVSRRDPRQTPLAEQQAVDAAGSGQPFEDAPTSPRVARVMEQLRSQPAPLNEVFALIKVTDRATGERRVLTRGTPDPMLGFYLENPDSAPNGQVYAEMEQGWAQNGVEVAIRSVLVGESGDVEPSLSIEQEEERELLERNGGTGLSHRIESDLRRMIEIGETDLSSDSTDPIPVMIELKNLPELSLPKAADPANGGLLWAGLDVMAERERRIIDRKRMMAERQRPLIEAIEALGGWVEYASWTSGSIQTELPPAVIEPLAAHPAVFSMEYIPPLRTDAHRFLGDDIHTATNAQDYDPWHQGWHGLSSKHSYTSRIVLAMSEECVRSNRQYWRTFFNGSYRGRFYDIDPNSGYTLGGLEDCVNNTSHGTTGHASHRHGHWVLGNMASDFMDGQEAVLTTAQRRHRTGTCEECFFLFGQDWNLNERTRAHDWACDKRADIFQSSISSGASCDGNGPFDGNLQSLVNCGAVYVQSAGNSGSTGGCTTSYPADHPWTFAVGGIDTQNPCDTPGEYYTTVCDYETNASKGGANYDGCGGCADVVDLAGPYRVCHGLDPNTTNPTGRQCLTGTSFASPIVAGLMARSMDWYRQHIGTGIFYDNRMRNFMLLMGDRSAGPSGGGQWLNTTDPRWGAGRVRLEPFDQLGCWVVHRLSVTLGRNSQFTTNLGAGDCVQFFKAVAWHNGRDYSHEPMIRLTLNPTGCSTPTASVNRLDAKTVLKMQLNGCSGVQMTIRNIGVGFSGTRRFHVAAYGKSGFSDRGF